MGADQASEAQSWNRDFGIVHVSQLNVTQTRQYGVSSSKQVELTSTLGVVDEQ